MYIMFIAAVASASATCQDLGVSWSNGGQNWSNTRKQADHPLWNRPRENRDKRRNL